MRKIGIVVVVGMLLLGASCDGEEAQKREMKEQAKEVLEEVLKESLVEISEGVLEDIEKERRADRMTSNESAAIKNMRAIHSAQEKFMKNAGYATSLAELSQAGLIDNVLGYRVKSGYLYSLSGDSFDWQCSATPISGITGSRNFLISTDAIVRFASGELPAGASSSKVE